MGGGFVGSQASLGAKSIYEEAPPIPAIKLVEAGRMRRDLEEPGKEKKKGAPETKTAAVAAASEPPSTPAADKKDGKDKEKEELQGVFAVRNGRAAFIPVETGIMGSKDVEVTKGLKPGEEIITGSYKVLRTLKPNTKVKIDNKASGPGGGESSS